MNLFQHWQEAAARAPVTDPARFNAPEYHHAHPDWPGWRVAVVLDATPGAPEGWPCWHATAVYGEIARGADGRGTLQPAMPLALWSRRTRRAAAKLLRRVLDGVGRPESQVVATVEDTIRETAKRGLPPAVGLSVRRLLTVGEAFDVLPPGALAESNRTAGLLIPGEPPGAQAPAEPDCAGERATQAGLHLDDSTPCEGPQCGSIGHG